jgi:hypothetical protein
MYRCETWSFNGGRTDGHRLKDEASDFLSNNHEDSCLLGWDVTPCSLTDVQ